MRRSWLFLVPTAALAAFLGAKGVRAGDTVGSHGSLFDLTNAVMAACPGTMGPYLGGGSASGESAMLAGAQQVAPMSSALDSAACTGAAAAPTRSAGLVIGLDAVVLVGSERTVGGAACNGDANLNCDSAFQPSTGAAYDTSIVDTTGAVYTFAGWRDVLRVLLAGLHHADLGTGATQWVRRNCNSAVRQALANDYGSLFENHCTVGAGEGGDNATFNPSCTQIRHVFRPDDYSSAAEALASILDLPPIVLPETTVGGVLQHTGASPFCNAVRPSFVYQLPPMTLQRPDITWDPTSTNVAGNGQETAVYRAPMQDNDPIRRLCAGTGMGSAPAEDVCSHSGDLGLVLPVLDVEELAPQTNADRYNARPCGRAKIAAVAAPEVFDATTQTRITCATGLVCPNGDSCNAFGGCFAPADDAGDPRCLASRLTKPALTANQFALPVGNPRLPALSDGRAHNQHLYDAEGGYQVLRAAASIAVTGAYYRIHARHSLAPAGETSSPPICQEADMTAQIGCLVTASPCSLGLAGGLSLSARAGIGTVKVNAQDPLVACIQDHFRYPLSRKVYLNSVPGFANVNGEELQLAGCFTDLAQPSHVPPTPSGILATRTTAAGLVPIPQSVNAGEPFCEDFNEAALCGATANVDACHDSATNVAAFPSFETICGDGRLDPWEECDQGAANGPPPAACSNTCRANQ